MMGLSLNVAIAQDETPIECEDCDTLSGAADFTFNIQAGGVMSDLYVCEVGFFEHHCLDHGLACGGDYIEVDGQTTKPGQDPLTFGPDDLVGVGLVKSGNVYLNSVNAGASWYVKYCLDVERKVVGEETPESFFGRLTSNMVATSGEDNNYYEYVGLKSTTYFSCTAPLTLAGLLGTEAVNEHLVTSEEEVEVGPMTTCMDFSGNTTNSCAWLVVYEETIPCLRELFRDLPGTEGATRSGSVKTAIDYTVEFNCTECAE
jgi:hypothetical protein